MKRNASLAVVLLAWLAVAGCAGGEPTRGGSEAVGGPPPEGKTPEQEGGREETTVAAACGRMAPTVEPGLAGPGENIVFRGGGFGGGCDDTNLPFRPEPPQQDVRISSGRAALG